MLVDVINKVNIHALGDHIVKLSARVFRFLRKFADTGKSNFVTEWERKTRGFDKVSFAFGAEWISDCNGEWYLLKTGSVEYETAVLYFLKYNDIPDVWIRQQIAEDSILERLTAFSKAGFGIPIKYLKEAAYRERNHPLTPNRTRVH